MSDINQLIHNHQITLRLPDTLLDRIDRHAMSVYESRATIIRRLLLQGLSSRERDTHQSERTSSG